MRKTTYLFASMAIALTLSSCGSQKIFLDMFSPEESGLNLVKITDEAAGSVIAGSTGRLVPGTNYVTTVNGFSKESNFRWYGPRNLTISPDGTELAYVTFANGQSNVVVRSAGSMGVTTQRTFRNVVGGICWGYDNRLYFGDANKPNYYICSIDAKQGTVMSQHTNCNVDDSFPALSDDGNVLYFTRWTSAYGPSIWSLNKTDGTLSSCARGYDVCPIPGDNEAFYCVRNSTAGKSEIWYVNYVKGQESIVLSDAQRSFTSPCLSPDGQWLLVVGNSTSSISKQQNTDIFVVRTNGSQLTQLTYHPETDMCPVWSRDGQYIFFISSRANKEKAYNIWRMTFHL